MRMSSWRTLAVVVGSVAAVACGSSNGGGGSTAPLKVQTRNVYLGGPVELVLGASTPQAIPAAVDQVWAIVQATNFAERAKALAAEIASTSPDVVGLQEVSLWRTQTPADGPATPATTVAYDFLQILLDELRNAHALTYTAVSTVDNADIEMTGTTNVDYRLTDRDVIIARSGVSTSNPQHGTYATKLPVMIGGSGGVAYQVPRGWTSVNVAAAGKTFRFVNTHVEAFNGQVNGAQATELSQLLASDANAVVVGDFNSGPGGAAGYTAYSLLTGQGGLTDAWTAAGGGAPGLTCCFDPTLQNASTALTSRVDLILLKGASASAGQVLGASTADRVSNLWPSDHAGVAATIQ